MHLGKRFAAAMIVVGLMAASASTSSASEGAGCDLYASPAGSASGNGSLRNPLGSPQELDRALAPGQTGCLLPGTYGSLSSVQRLTTDGTPSEPITITTAPGQWAKVVGLVEVEGSYTTVSGLTIDGSNRLYDAERSGTNCPYPVSNGLEIDGRGDIFQDNDFYQSVASLRGNGIGIGWNRPADNAIIRDNRIHDLGQCQAFDQMIYLAHGDGVQIYDNWMWNDRHGWGVQVYPAASNAHIYDNVIDGAGSGFVIGGSSEVAHNAIDHNIIINSTGLPEAGLSGVGVSTCCGLGSGNSFTNNIVYNNPGGIAIARGITLSGNTAHAPRFADAAAHDYRPTTASPDVITHWSLWDGQAGAMPTAVPAAVHTREQPTRRHTTSRHHDKKRLHRRRNVR
jgi:parallel beta-helix repeat protein